MSASIDRDGAASALRVVVVEQQPAVRVGLGLLLRASGLNVDGTAQTVEEAETLILSSRPDVALIGGAFQRSCDLARAILRQWPGARLLAYVDGRLDEVEIEGGFDGGLAGFASKTGEAGELLAAIRQVAGGKVYLDPRFRQTNGESSPRKLTARQREILRLLAAGLTSEQVARELVVSKQTIDTHVRNLMARLGAKTRTHAVAIAVARREIELPQTG